ncbi:MAG: DNA primase [Rickettsiales bacterium]|nr:DNA primase [Rickettsiales bacterium]
MRFPKDFPEKLRSSILTSEVVGKKVKLKARGHEFQGLCPFHNEKSPSFTVNDLKGFYHCFGCAEHGDVISFVMKTDGLEYPEAVTKLADDFGIPIPKVIVNEAKENALERDYLILEKICQFFEKNLHGENGFEARNYLKKRNLNSTSAKKFRLGFAPNSYEALVDFLKAEGFAELEMSRTGVIGQNDRKKLYTKFRNRVIFPITDKKNRVIAFGGRCLGDEMPKYLNSSETEFFKKNQTLYNFFFARKAIFSKGFAVVVEGYMDAIALATNGIENVVAGLGTALGTEHLKDLFYTTDKIIVCLDGDDAGIRAAKRVSEIALPLINAKKNVAFAILPNRMDPDDFIKEFGARELEKVFENATPLSESLFDFALMELAIDKNKKISAENKAKIEGNLNAKIEAITDPSSKKYFSFFFKDLLFSLGKKNPTKGANLGLIKNYAKPASSLSDSIARNIIALIVKYPELAQFRDEDFDVRELHFSNEDLSHLKELAIEAIENNEENLLAPLENSPFSKDVVEIKNILARLGAADLDSVLVKFRILLLKDLLLHVELQYKESLSQIDEIETHQTAITNQKIREIFDYKNSLEQRILALEKELI